MPENVRYESFEAEASASPLLSAAGLVRSGVFDRYMVYEKHGGFTVAGGIEAELIADRDGVRFVRDGVERAVPWNDRGLTLVAELLAGLPMADWRVYGWAAFELSYLLAGDAAAAGDGRLLHLVVPTVEVTFGADRVTGRGLAGDLRDRVVDLLRSGTAVAEEGYARNVRPMDVAGSGPDAGRYQEAVAGAVWDIQRGRLQKVILSRVLPVEFEIDLLATWVAGRRGNNPARSFLFDLGGLRGGGFSPEIVLEVRPDGVVSTQPLAGTRAATGAADVDDRHRAELLSDAKEIFEHATSVKAAVDELSRFCVPDSVGVYGFMTVKHRGSVQHLGSMVTGSLAAGWTGWDAMAVLFPAITASGIPKRPAYEAIRRYEPEPRGLYAGAVLTAGADGSLDAALVLRSVYQQDGRTWLRAGAGIVEQSRPGREYEETCEKLRSVADHLVPGPVAQLAGSGVAAGSRTIR
ncbi:salicylate synthase [Micromonospora sp. NPDC002296]|uniref:salicylate synthase n=1 Tax=Micromonospora sp. NPDC002296 TaxID=3154271 RepID=UPI00331E9356